MKRIGEYKEKHRDERLEHCRERVSGLSGGHHTNVRETGRFKCVCLARVSWRERCRVSRMELVKDAGLYWNPSERLLEWREKQYFFLFSFFSSNLPSLPPLFGWNAGGRDRHWFSRERCLALVLFFKLSLFPFLHFRWLLGAARVLFLYCSSARHDRSLCQSRRQPPLSLSRAWTIVSHLNDYTDIVWDPLHEIIKSFWFINDDWVPYIVFLEKSKKEKDRRNFFYVCNTISFWFTTLSPN